MGNRKWLWPFYKRMVYYKHTSDRSAIGHLQCCCSALTHTVLYRHITVWNSTTQYRKSSDFGGIGSLKEGVKKHRHTGMIKMAIKTSQPFNNKHDHPKHKPTAKPCQTNLKAYPFLSACIFAVAFTLLSACQPLFTSTISSV